MKKPFAVLLALLALLSQPARAESIDTLAKNVILVDSGTGTVLLDKGANDRMPTASMSKTMTMYMLFDALKAGRVALGDEFLVSERAWKMQGSKMFIHVGDKVKVEDLIRGVIIQSGNDAAVAVAEGLAGSEEAFATAMNARMQEIGMKDSHFTNASGWPDPEHYSTPRDLALLAYRLIHDHPEHYHYFSEKDFTYGLSLKGKKITQQNRDPLIGKLPGADGIKTGHTDEAGYGLIGSAKRGERRLILVMSGLDSMSAREQEGIRLMEWGFRNFENKTLFKKGETVESAQVWLGQSAEVPLVAKDDLVVVLPVANRGAVQAKVVYDAPLKAPVKKGETAGKLLLEVPGQPPVTLDLVTGADVARQGVFGRVKNRLGYLLTGTF